MAEPTTNREWVSMVLTDLGAPDSKKNQDNMLRWMANEHGSETWSGARGQYNPWNNGQGSGGGSGLGSYPDLETSAKYAAQLLKANAHGYPAIKEALTNEHSTDADFSKAVVHSDWASGHYGVASAGAPKEYVVPGRTEDFLASVRVPPDITVEASQRKVAELHRKEAAVMEVQGQLGVTIDGDAPKGGHSDQALKDFQAKHGIKPTGFDHSDPDGIPKLDDKTRAALAAEHPDFHVQGEGPVTLSHNKNGDPMIKQKSGDQEREYNLHLIATSAKDPVAFIATAQKAAKEGHPLRIEISGGTASIADLTLEKTQPDLGKTTPAATPATPAVAQAPAPGKVITIPEVTIVGQVPKGPTAPGVPAQTPGVITMPEVTIVGERPQNGQREMDPRSVVVDGVAKGPNTPVDVKGNVKGMSFDAKTGMTTIEIEDKRGNARSIGFKDPVGVGPDGEPIRHPLGQMVAMMDKNNERDTVHVVTDGKGNTDYAVGNKTDIDGGHSGPGNPRDLTSGDQRSPHVDKAALDAAIKDAVEHPPAAKQPAVSGWDR
jgi:hypothetical protein